MPSLRSSAARVTPGSLRARISPFICSSRADTTWLLAHDRARWADDGWASAESTLWTEDGKLVAYATQMMLFTYLTAPA